MISSFKAKMNLIQFRLGLRSDPAGGAHSVPPDSLARFWGTYFYKREGERGREREGRGRVKERSGKGRDKRGKGNGGKGRRGPPS